MLCGAEVWRVGRPIEPLDVWMFYCLKKSLQVGYNGVWCCRPELHSCSIWSGLAIKYHRRTVSIETAVDDEELSLQIRNHPGPDDYRAITISVVFDDSSVVKPFTTALISVSYAVMKT